MELFKKILARIKSSDAIVSGIFKMRALDAAEDDYKFRFVTLKHCSQSNLLCGLAVGINDFYKLDEKIQLQSEIGLYQKENFDKFLSLSEREKEILCLTMRGMSNKETADQLFISIDTVKQHLKNIRSKTELQKMPELMRFAQAFEII
jgi:DNA-binding CsgD family transcriptional regulator